MDIKLVSEPSAIQVIAVGRKIREFDRLQKVYGPGRWRKLKGTARARLPDGSTCSAEVHWYEAHGIGRREVKLKRILGP